MKRDGKAARILWRGIKTDYGTEAAPHVRNPLCKEQETENAATKHARRTPDVRNAKNKLWQCERPGPAKAVQ